MDHERFKCTKNISVFGIIGNVFLCIIKIIAGIMSNSQAIIADSLNSASDIFASFMSYVGARISSIPKDDSHELGHGKAEYIFSMFISISMIIIAVKLLYNGVASIVLKNEIIFSIYLIIVCIITIIVKFALYLISRRSYKKHHNILLKASMEDHRNDMIITTFTLISIIFSQNVQYRWLDGVLGIAISLWIMFIGIKIFIESFNVLMDKSLNKKQVAKICNIIKNYPEIEKTNRICSFPVGYNYIIILELSVDGKYTTSQSHEVAENIKKDIITHFDNIYDVVVHIDPK